jgi:hypothetical protein
MIDILAPILVGWPMIGLVMFIALVGLIWKRWWLLLVGAVLSLPPVYYLSGNPSIQYLSFLAPLFLAGAAFAVKSKKKLAGW